MLTVTDLTVRFGAFAAIDGLSLTVDPGRLTALIGPNGAGKTTAFNAISGLLRPASGSIFLEGQKISGRKPENITACGLVRTFQIARGFPKLTVFEHLALYAQDNPAERFWSALRSRHAQKQTEIAERALETAKRLKLDHVIDNRVTALSGGQKKLLEIGRALMAQPRLLLLDEPAAGVNPTLGEEIADQLLSLVADGLTILLIEHDMALVGRIADHVIVMAQGRNFAEGAFAEIQSNRDVQDAYLGGGVVDALN